MIRRLVFKQIKKSEKRGPRPLSMVHLADKPEGIKYEAISDSAVT